VSVLNSTLPTVKLRKAVVAALPPLAANAMALGSESELQNNPSNKTNKQIHCSEKSARGNLDWFSGAEYEGTTLIVSTGFFTLVCSRRPLPDVLVIEDTFASLELQHKLEAEL